MECAFLIANFGAATMKQKRLTKKQRRLIAELDEIAPLIGVDYHTIQDSDDPEKTTNLELAKDQLVRGEVIWWYTVVDEFMNSRLARYFFPRRSFIQLWKTKKFQNFNYFALEELSLMQKVRFVKAIMKLPNGIVRDIERLNALRNGLAHAFFPWNLKKSKPIWKGNDIYSLEGIRAFEADMDILDSFFMKTAKADFY
jgi:hypothetical protein